jgi:carbon monoxide dehydrogenase subunit G
VIETAHSLMIEAPIATVWDYVEDMRRWANLLPGCQECIVENPENSRWILKVGTGGLVRTVNALVHVDNWAGPSRVDFSYKLEGDPVEGSGSYLASETGPTQTEVTLQVRVQGSGPLAPMWEAISRPLLPRLAKMFATKLKEEIEQAAQREPGDRVQNAEAPARRSLGQKIRSLLSSQEKE